MARLLTRHLATIGLGLAAVVQSCGGSDADSAKASGGTRAGSGGVAGAPGGERGGDAGSAANPLAGAGGALSPEGGAGGVPTLGEGGKRSVAGAGRPGLGAGDQTASDGGSAGTVGFVGDPVVYDFEVDAQEWTANASDVSVRVSSDHALTGARSLTLDLPALGPKAKREISVFNPRLWPGTSVALHIWAPADADRTISARAFAKVNNDDAPNANGSVERTLEPGAWTTLSYTVPSTFPGGLQDLGVELSTLASGYPGGTLYLDTVTASGGVADCTGPGTGFYDFSPNDVATWEIDEDSSGGDFSIESSTERALPGGPALKVSFNSMAAPEPGLQAIRRIVLNRPDVYCGEVVTFNFWVPLTSDHLIIQAFADYDNGWTDVGTVETLFRNGWSVFNYTIPAIETGGLQRLGVQFAYFGDAPYTDTVYVDNVAW